MDYDKQSKGPDDVEKSLELLDKVLSEFEDPESLPPVEPESPSQGHQSEDDGYMSMNGRRAKFAPDFQPTDEVSSLMAPNPPIQSIPIEEKSSTSSSSLSTPPPPPPPEEAERIISSLLPKISPTTSPTDSHKGRKNVSPSNDTNTTSIGDIIQNGDNSTEIVPLQTTLPKARPSSSSVPFRFGSLPCTSPPRILGPPSSSLDGGGGRTVLGIGISAVHDAVLRGGVARIPEPILNEHPVTIYPGRASPQKRVPPRTLPGSIERHREVCRNTNNPNGSRDSSQENLNNILNQSSPDERDSSLSPQSLMVNQIFINTNLGRTKRKNNSGDRQDSNSEDFSDDSLEESSLPPPPPQVLVPPLSSSLSAPVTPSKRGSIAWDINLDDPNSFDDPIMIKSNGLGSTKVITKRNGRSVSGSQSSLASTPGQSTGSNKRSGSVELLWPEPPICSTEDEAASLYSDSDDIGLYSSDMTGTGTYVIRKGRKQRNRLSDMDSMSSINSRLSNEGNINVPSPVYPLSMILTNSRHSLDLGSPPPPPPVQNSLNSPRSRLSLDLSSPTSELPTNTNIATSSTIISPRYTEFKSYSSTFDGLQALENSNNNNNNINNNNSNNISNGNGLPLMRVSSLPAITQPPGDVISTPRRELAPPIEEDEEQDSESQRGAPLRQIENNISALLRGDIPVARVSDLHPSRRPLGFRPGVHKSESAKEMLLSQTTSFGPLPPSPPSTSPEMECDGFPPLPPSPTPEDPESYRDVVHGIHSIRLASRSRLKSDHYYREIDHPPVVPPHRGPSINTLKTRSMDAGFSKSYRNGPYNSISQHIPGTLPPELPGSSSRRRLTSGAFPKRTAQSPREERRLQTSCSLPETPIFARGCDIPRTPHRRAPELPGTGSRTAPRQTTGMSSIIGIGSGGRQSISQALATGEMLRMAGGPARGWYPKQRHHRPASTENLDRLQGSIRAWDAAGTGSRKPLTLPPNLTPKFFNKSPREALRRVTSLLIRKGNGVKESKRDKEKELIASSTTHRCTSAGEAVQPTTATTTTTPPATTQKKKGFFKSFWKKSKHYSLEQ